MKFKNITDKEFVDVSLILAGILPRGTTIKPGDIIDIKDPEMAKRIQINANYQKVEEAVPKKATEEKKKGGK